MQSSRRRTARVGTDGTRRVPDLLCNNPHTQVEYVVDARIFWNMMSDECKMQHTDVEDLD